MSQTTPAIRGVKARAVVVPLKRPVKNAFGLIDAGPLVLIDVETDQGVTGRSYIFAYTRLTLKSLVLLIEEIGRDLVGKAIAPFDLMAAMDAKFRLLGWQGLVGMAVSGLDMAFWDALGQVAGKPVVELLGGSARPIRAYDSYGVVDPAADERALRHSLEQGFRGIKIKGGDGDAANDERVVKGDRGRSERLHHAGSDEGRRRHRLARRGGASRSGLDPDVEPPVRRGERAHACGHADRALVGAFGLRRRHSRRPGQDRRRHPDRARARTRDRLE